MKRTMWSRLFAAGAYATLVACSSPAPQSGTNTNWACKADSDCADLGAGALCRDRVCTAATSPPAPGTPNGAGGASAQSAMSGVGGAAFQNGELSRNGRLLKVVPTDSGWIAVGQTFFNDAVVLTSDDGRTWVADPIAKDVPKGGLFDVAYGNGTAVAIGFAPSGIGVVTKPPNGGWQLQVRSGTLPTLAFGNGVFLLKGNVDAGSVSTNGIDWTDGPDTAAWNGFVDGRFVDFHYLSTDGASVASRFRTSPDGLSWSTPEASTTPLRYVFGLALVGDRMLGYANLDDCHGQPQDCGHEVELQGPRGSSMAALTTGPTPWPTPVVGIQTSIAASATRVVVNASALVWSTALPLGSSEWQSAQGAFNSIAYARGVFVAVGEKNQRPNVSVSSDGLAWEDVSLPEIVSSQ